MNKHEQLENTTALSRCINKFLDDKFGEKNTRSKEDYGHYILEFSEYVKLIYPQVIDNPEQIFRNFQFDEIERSLEDYISRKNDRAKHSNHKTTIMSIIMKYTSVVTEFFMYLSRIGWLNANLIARLNLDDDDNKSRKKMFARIAKKYGLSNAAKSPDAISEEEAEHLLLVCERKISRATKNLKISFDEYNYNVFLRNLILELMLLLGIKCSKIINIKYSHYDKIKNRISVCGFEITLPVKLREQFTEYDSFRRRIIDGRASISDLLPEESLFVAFNGTFHAVLNNEKKPIPINSNQYYKNTLFGYPAYNSITPVINRAVITMIKQRVDRSTIMTVSEH